MWKLTEFGETSPTDLSAIFNRREPQGTTPVTSRLIQTPSGYYDPLGDDRARPNAPLITLDGEIYSSDAMLDEVQALTGDIGVKRKLYRDLDDGTTQWVMARLMRCEIDRNWPNVLTFPVRMAWEALGPWQGAYHLETDTVDVSSGSGSYTVSNDGNTRQENVNLVIVPNSTGPMTDIEIECTGANVHIHYEDDVIYLQELEIDSELMTVMNNGADAFDGLYVAASHTIPRFLTLEPGNNQFDFDVTGVTSIKVYFTYYDAWA